MVPLGQMGWLVPPPLQMHHLHALQGSERGHVDLLVSNISGTQLSDVQHVLDERPPSDGA